MKAKLLVASVIALEVVLILAGCSRGSVADSTSGTASPPDKSAATITASPNPVPPGPDFGTTTISWNTGDGTIGEVYLAENDKPEKLFAGERSQGVLETPWIGAGGIYEFRLYAGKEHKKLLASVKVVRAER